MARPEHPPFLSYSHADEDAAGELRDRLLAEAEVVVFQDRTGLRSGDRWMGRLQDALRECGAFIVLVGREGVRRWVGAETEVALNRHLSARDASSSLTIHPVLLPSADSTDLPPFLALFQAEAWSPGTPLPTGLVKAITGSASSNKALPLIETCPYVGLEPFGPQHAWIFFGRRLETLQALASLGDQLDRPPTEPSRAHSGGSSYIRWLQIEGASGTGKSSLVMAGMLPEVERGALWARTKLEHWTVLGPLLPGKEPLARLAEVLERGLKAEPHQRDMQGRRDRLAADKDALRFAIQEWKEPGTGYLLVIDQMEELLAPIDAEQRAQFDRLLAVALEDAECPLFVVSTIRSDFIDRFNLLPCLGRLQNTLCKAYRLYSMSTESLREAIELPARLAGLDVSEVASLMVGEAEDEPGALPLVENALSRLWDPMRRDKLSGQQFKDAGGLAGMLSEGADALLKRIDGAIPGGRTAALELLLRLTRVNPDGRHTRQRISRDEAVQAAGQGDDVKGEQVLLMMSGERPTDRPTSLSSDRLRLVVISEEGGKSYVDLVHETLLRARRHPKDLPGEPERPYWPTLHQYILANLDRDLLRQQLELLAQRYRRRAGQLDRWRHLATWSQLWDFRRLRLVQGSDEARFVALSQRFAATATVSVLAVLVAVGSGLQFAWNERQLTRAIAALASSSPQKRADAAYQIFATDQKRGFVRLLAVYEEKLRASAAPGKTTVDVDFQRLGALEAIASPKLAWSVEDANRRRLLMQAMLEDPSPLIRHKAAAGLPRLWPDSLTQMDDRYRGVKDRQPPATRVEPSSQSVMVWIPATLAVIGNDEGDPAESPAHVRPMASFWIDRGPVTNAQWTAVMKDDPPEYEKSAGQCSAIGAELRASRTSAANADKPVVGITYQQAATYCDRSGERRLPSELQYEVSARGAEGWIFPWGMSPRPAERQAARGVKLKADLKAAHGSVSLRQFQGELAAADIDVSLYGVGGLVTTVRHWTRTGWTGAHGRSGDGPDCKDWCVVKGASVIEADDSSTRFQSSRRLRIDTLNDHVDDNIGFRCVDEKP